jgi:hypothetical protein
MASRIRILGLLLLLLVGATSLMAQPDHETWIYYYTDATYTTQCGYLHYDCFGWGWTGSGCRTEWSIDVHGDPC